MASPKSRPNLHISPKAAESKNKFKASHSPSLYGDNFDSGGDLLQRLKSELSSITQNLPNPSSKGYEETPLDRQLGELFKRRQKCQEKEAKVTAELHKLMGKKVEEGEEQVRCVKRIVNISARPGYIEYPAEKPTNMNTVQRLTTELSNVQRELRNLDEEAIKLQREDRKRNQSKIDAMACHVQRLSDARTGKTSPSNKTKGSANDINTSVNSFNQWFNDYGKPKLTNEAEAQQFLTTFKKSKARLKNYGIDDAGKKSDTTGFVSSGKELRLGRLTR